MKSCMVSTWIREASKNDAKKSATWLCLTDQYNQSLSDGCLYLFFSNYLYLYLYIKGKKEKKKTAHCLRIYSCAVKIHYFPFSLAGPSYFYTFFLLGLGKSSSFLFDQWTSQSILGFRNPMYAFFFLFFFLFL